MPVVRGPFRRVVGRVASGRGPTLVVCGGLHGNEPAGVIAAERVLRRLEADRIAVRGEVVGLAGNLAALAAGQRFMDFDLNRFWQADRPRSGAEASEFDGLRAEIEAAMARATGPVTLLDLHTTSGDSPPFVLMADTLRNRRVARALPGPVVLGLEEMVDGTLVEYATASGLRSIVVEGGRHDDPRAIDLHEAAIWLLLRGTGVVPDPPDLATWRRRYGDACRGLPRTVEVRHRHAVRPNDGFRMKRGYRGFQPVAEREVVAHDRDGPIVAPERSLVLMPRYQPQGDDGFFLVRPVRLRLRVGALLRRLRLHPLLRLLPGVARHPRRAHALRVEPRAAERFASAFHLFGFRRFRAEDGVLVVSRRRQK